MVQVKQVKSHDTYEIAFYMLWGAEFRSVRKTPLWTKRAKKKGFVDMWTITVDNVPHWAIETWRTGKAFGNISDFVIIRNKLKKLIKRELDKNY